MATNFGDIPNNAPIDPTTDLDVTGTSAGEQLTVDAAGTALEWGLASKFLSARKGSAGTISTGTPVYISGYNVGGWIEVETSDSSTASTMPAVGLAYEDLTNGASGRVLLFGLMDGLDTSSYAEGDELYVAAAAGAGLPWLTSTKPTTGDVQKMAIVSRSNVATGSIVVFSAGRTNDIPNVTDRGFTMGGDLDLGGNDIVNAGNVPSTIRTVAASGADYTTIASALSDAVAGDTISLKAGESFAENITISTDRITLNSYGEGARPAVTGTLANGINVTAEHVTIDGIAVTGWTQRGITSADAHYLTVRDCYTYGTDATGQSGNPNNGIRVVNSAATFVYGVVIEDCEIGQVGTTDLDDIYNVGVVLQECHAPIVRNNRFTDTKGYGIVLDSCAQAHAYGNHLEGTTGGIAVWNESDNALIQRNRIANGTGMGIGVSYECDGVVVEDNLIFNLGAATNTWNGIDVNNNCQNGLIRGNRIWGVARHCVVIDASSNPVSDGWTIEGNYLDARENTTHLDSRLLPLGIRDFDGTPAITFTENNNVFIPNTGFDGGDKVASEGTGDGTTYDLAGWRTATSQGADSRVPVDTDALYPMSGDLDLGGNDITDVVALRDSTGAKFLDFVEGSTPVNYVRVQNTPSGTGPYVTAQGPADDIPLRFGAKGTEVVRFLSPADLNDNELQNARLDSVAPGRVATVSAGGELVAGGNLVDRAGSVSVADAWAEAFNRITTGSATITVPTGLTAAKFTLYGGAAFTLDAAVGVSFTGVTDPYSVSAGEAVVLQQLASDSYLVITSSAGGAGGLSNLIDDGTPQLGGNLDVNDFKIVNDDVGNHIVFKLGDAAGAHEVQVQDSADAVQFRVDSDGNIQTSGFYDAGTGNNLSIKLGDAAGVNQFNVADSSEVVVWNVDSDGTQTMSNDLLLAGNDISGVGWIDQPSPVRKIVNEGADNEYRLFGPPPGVAMSGRAVLFCHPWGGDMTSANAPDETNALISHAVGRGDVVVVVQGATWDTTPEPDEPNTTGVFSNSAITSQPYWDYHQAAADAAEAETTLFNGAYISEWHAVGVSWGGWAAAWFASKSDQAATDGTVRSCQLVAAVLDLNEFYNDNTGFRSGLEIGFDQLTWPITDTALSPVNFASTDLDNCPFWFCHNGDTGTEGSPNGTDGTITLADHATALGTAIGTSAWFRTEVTYWNSGAAHLSQGVIVFDNPEKVYGFIESVSESTTWGHVAAQTFTAYGQGSEISFGGQNVNNALQTAKPALAVGGNYRTDVSQVHELIDDGAGGVELPTAVGFYGTWELSTSAPPNLFGTGYLFHMDATVRNKDGEAVNFGPLYGLLFSPTLTAVNAVQDLDILPVTALRDETKFDRTGTGTWDIGTGTISLWSAPVIDTGTTMAYRVGVRIDESTGSGTITGQAGVMTSLNTADATNTSQLLIGTTTIPSGDYALYSTSTDDVRLAGDIDMTGSDLKNVGNIQNPTYRNPTGTTDTLVLADGNKTVYCSNASQVTVTIPTNASVAFPVGTRINIVSGGAGGVTLTTTSLTLLPASANKTIAEGEAFFLEKAATDTWIIVGGTSA